MSTGTEMLQNNVPIAMEDSTELVQHVSCESCRTYYYPCLFKSYHCFRDLPIENSLNNSVIHLDQGVWSLCCLLLAFG